MSGRLMKIALMKHEAKLRKIFAFFAGADVSMSGQGQASSTMNIKETATLFDRLGLFDSKYGVREMVAAFVRVNIDDELYEQEEQSNDSSELVFDEFCEVIYCQRPCDASLSAYRKKSPRWLHDLQVLARLFYGREWDNREGWSADDPFLGVEVGFHQWLSSELVPAALKLITARTKV